MDNIENHKKVSSFINRWQQRNPFKKENLKRHNQKFNKDFSIFLSKYPEDLKEYYLN